MARGDNNLTLTDANVKTLECVEGRERTEYTDTVLPGLTLRVSSSGNRSYVFQYRFDGKQERATIGNIKKVTLAGARETCRDIVRSRENPAEVKRQRLAAQVDAVVDGENVYTFEKLCDAFVREESKHWRPSTKEGWLRYIEKEIKPAIGDKIPTEVKADHIRDLIDRIKNGVQDSKGNWKRKAAPTSARRCFEVVRAVCGWAVYKGKIQISPCTAARERHRRRGAKAVAILKPYSDDQLRGIFEASKGTEMEDLVDLIARTGVRSHEARSARESDIRKDVWSIPPEFHKNGAFTGLPQLVPLSKGAKRVIERRETESDWVFPGENLKCRVCNLPGHMDPPVASTVVATIKEAAGVKGRGLLHRLRDTIKTRMSEHGIDGRVSEFILGHIVPGIAGTYDHAELLPQRREALEWWDEELDRILKSKGKKRRVA